GLRTCQHHPTIQHLVRSSGNRKCNPPTQNAKKPKIHVIDHNSKYDLSVVKQDRVSVYRANMATYFQEEFTNVVLDKVLRDEALDWLFILDVDEFLPFFSWPEFSIFLDAHSSHKVIQFSWRNGVPLDHVTHEDGRGVSDSKSLIFYKDMASTKKCAVNIRLMGRNFYIPRSNHRVQRRRNFFGLMPSSFLRVKGHDTGRELYHIISSSLEDFSLKIRHFKDVRQKFMGVKGHGGSLILQYPDAYSIEDWLSFTANYRSGDPKQISRAELSDFRPVDLFSTLDSVKIGMMRAAILAHPVPHQTETTNAEQGIVNAKKKYGIKKRLCKAFLISGTEIRIR
ncbi:hypothetical protein, partial [Roseovarius sp. SYSU LYC5161]|uniref:hypothetical protein n=1 Tax=Roseovarius halophilus (ex Wu et al. 2025) TaxID=3376060 RepID=UPI003999A292